MYFENIFSDEELDYIVNLPEVISFKEVFEASHNIKRKILVDLPMEITDKINALFGMNLVKVPITLLRGDIRAHTDIGSKSHQFTHLIYLENSEGNFVLDQVAYPIQKNTGFKFSEDIEHETRDTNNSVRLLIGPMDENGNTVEIPRGVYYFPTLTDAEAFENLMANSDDDGTYVVGENITSGSIGSYTYWQIYSAFGDDIPPDFDMLAVRTNGDTLITQSDPGHWNFFFLYPADYIPGNICFAAGTPIITDQGEIEIEKIDNKIHTISGKPILLITKSIGNDKSLVTFYKDALGENSPKTKTTLTENHKVMHEGELKKAITLVNGTSIKAKPYKGEMMYNILMQNYTVVNANGMICETLDPRNRLLPKNKNLYKHRK